MLIEKQQPDINEQQDIVVFKILELVPRFKFLNIKSNSFLGSLGFFWKIVTPVFGMKIEGKIIIPEGPEIIHGSNPPFSLGSGWIKCLYDLAPEMMRSKNTWKDFYDMLNKNGKCFTVESIIPRRTKYFSGIGTSKSHGLILVASKKLVLTDRVIDFSDKLNELEQQIILKKLKSWN